MLVLLFAACFPRLDPSEADSGPVPDDTGPVLVETRCGDGEDDDGDGDIDCDDADCIGARTCEEDEDDTDTDSDSTPDEETDCEDGDDEDEDGDTDCDDSDCDGDDACEEPAACWDEDADDALGAAIAEGTASGNDGNASCGGASTADTFVTWTAPATDTFVFDTVGSVADTTLWVAEETCDGAELACDTDTFGTDSQVTLSLSRGDRVVVGIEAAGAWTLSAWQGDCPAYTIGDALAVTGSTTVSTTDLTSGVCTSDPESVVTLRWITPSSDTWTFSTDGSDFDTILALYEDTCDGDEIDCNDDITGGEVGGPSEISTWLSAGDVVTIAVGGYGGDTGAYVLDISNG